MIRKIIHINEEKCNGCGACANACHEGAIAMVDGKAKLIRDDYCDGMGDCLPECPAGAITFEEREAAAYNAQAVAEHMKQRGPRAPISDRPNPGDPELRDPHPAPDASGPDRYFPDNPEPRHPHPVPDAPIPDKHMPDRPEPRHPHPVPDTPEPDRHFPAGPELRHPHPVPDAPQPLQGGCPGSRIREMKPGRDIPEEYTGGKPVSQLRNWPIQIKLAPIKAPYFDGSRLLIAADCTAYAYAALHQEFMRGRVTLIGCPKLDAVDYSEKLTEIIRQNDIRSVTIVRMEVPCCGGLEMAAKQAIQASGKFIPWQVVTVSIDGKLLDW